jgi:hypothetical protein
MNVGMLGKNPAVKDRRALKLANYTGTMPAPPVEVRWDKAIPVLGMGGNDVHGNCVTVTAAHIDLSMRANAGRGSRRISDARIVAQARTIGGLEGFSILARNKIWRKAGLWGKKIGAFATITPSDPLDMRIAVNEFGAADIGLLMPVAWQTADVWDVGRGSTFKAGSWGGHSVPALGYDANGLWVATWGRMQFMTWAALVKYCDEGFAIISPAWLTTHGKSPSGFDLARLTADLAEVTK